MEAVTSLYKSGLGSNKWVQIWIITMTELIGDLNLKTFATTNVFFHFYAGIFLYIILALELAVGFQTMGLGWLNGAWDGTSTVVSVLVGRAGFCEYALRILYPSKINGGLIPSWIIRNFSAWQK